MDEEEEEREEEGRADEVGPNHRRQASFCVRSRNAFFNGQLVSNMH